MTYTKRQIMEHLADAIADNSDIEGRAEHLINALRLPLEDPTPGPGWYASRSGSLAFVDREGKAHFFGADRTWSETPNGDWGKYFTPARVVPADHEADAELWRKKCLELEAAMVELKPDDEDERIRAWHEIASHPFFKECYDVEAPLIESMTDKLSKIQDALALLEGKP